MALKSKLLPCEIPDCTNFVAMRSTIKTGEHRGKKVCPYHKNVIEGKKTINKPLKKFTKKNQEKRKEERKGLPNFFESAIEDLQKNPFCQNCGGKINSSYQPHWNVSHILPKSKYKSVMAHPENYLLLCSSKDDTGRSCHNEFDDNGVSHIPTMHCFKLAKEKFEKFREEVLEKGKEFNIFVT